MSLICCENVSFAYEGTDVLTGVTFEINAGDYLCVIGENGSGKSTLIRGLLGIKSPSTGKIEYGQSLRRGEIGYLPQQTNVQKNFPASVYEIVLSGRLNSLGLKPFYTKADLTNADENMRLMGISDLKRKSYNTLSGGQQQRVLLARALCATKKLLLLDEPAAGLDPKVTRELYELLKTINRERGITVVMVSHDIHCALDYSSHILHLGNEQLFFGTLTDYVSSDVGTKYLCVWGCEHHQHGDN